jgi:hypothetical protein
MPTPQEIHALHVGHTIRPRELDGTLGCAMASEMSHSRTNGGEPDRLDPLMNVVVDQNTVKPRVLCKIAGVQKFAQSRQIESSGQENAPRHGAPILRFRVQDAGWPLDNARRAPGFMIPKPLILHGCGGWI